MLSTRFDSIKPCFLGSIKIVLPKCVRCLEIFQILIMLSEINESYLPRFDREREQNTILSLLAMNWLDLSLFGIDC